MKKIHNNLSFHSDSYSDGLHTCEELDLEINRLWSMGEECSKHLEKKLRSAGIAVSYGSISVHVDERIRMRRHTGKDGANRFMGTSCKSEPEILKQCIRGSDCSGPGRWSGAWSVHII